MDFLYLEATPYWGQVLGILILTFIAVSGTYIWGSLLTANGDLKKMNFIFVVGILLNVILNYFFILEYKAAGAAVATLLTQFFVLLAQIILAANIFKLKLNVVFMVKIMLFILCVIGISYGIYNNVSWDWKIRLVLSGVLSILVAVPFGLVQPTFLLRKA